MSKWQHEATGVASDQHDPIGYNAKQTLCRFLQKVCDQNGICDACKKAIGKDEAIYQRASSIAKSYAKHFPVGLTSQTLAEVSDENKATRAEDANGDHGTETRDH